MLRRSKLPAQLPEITPQSVRVRKATRCARNPGHVVSRDRAEQTATGLAQVRIAPTSGTVSTVPLHPPSSAPHRRPGRARRPEVAGAGLRLGWFVP